MSGLCLINLKEHNLDEKKLDKLATKLVRIALKNHIAVHFNCGDYGRELVSEEKIHDFFIISHTFLYKNCDLLDVTPLILKLSKTKNFDEFLDNYLKNKTLPNKDEFWEKFYIKFDFFNEIIDCIFLYDVSVVEIFITENYGPVAYSEDFQEKITTRKTFLADLFSSLVDTLHNHFDYEFPNAKFLVSK